MGKVLIIDPGTSNLGWALMECGQILAAGVDHIWSKDENPAFHPSLNAATATWYRERRETFRQAKQVLIELQYISRGVAGCFPPMIVMDSLVALCEYDFPGKVKMISPSAVKRYFDVEGSYDERKHQVVELAGLGHLAGRVHDIADCILIYQYETARSLHQRKIPPPRGRPRKKTKLC